MTREEFIELSKTALAPALKGRRRPDGSVHLINKFYKEGKDDWIAINKEEFELRLQSYKDLLNNK